MIEHTTKSLDFQITPQPTETSCGPACLHAIYRYFDEEISLMQIMHEVSHLEAGGTLAVFLACHALHRGYSATIYTYNLSTFDPTWFLKPDTDLKQCLISQKRKKNDRKLHEATEGYLEFLQSGGRLCFEDLTTALIRKYLNRSIPILTGLSSTYLYQSPREWGPEGKENDIKGEPVGHFVVLYGYNRKERTVMVADPLSSNPFSKDHHYIVNIDRVLCSILLGVLTYDANLLVITPQKNKKGM